MKLSREWFDLLVYLCAIITTIETSIKFHDFINLIDKCFLHRMFSFLFLYELIIQKDSQENVPNTKNKWSNIEKINRFSDC